MRAMISIVVSLFVIVVGMMFYMMNSQMVSVDLGVGQHEVSLAIALLMFLFFGAIIGSLVTSMVVYNQKRELARLNKQLKTADEEIRNLRKLPLQE